VIVDLPVTRPARRSAGGHRHQLGTLSLVSKAATRGRCPSDIDGDDKGMKGAGARFFNTATFLTYTDWQNGCLDAPACR
jgi:hypothetical protein